MFRSPSFNPSPSRRALGRNLALDLVAAMGVGVSMAPRHRPPADDRATRRSRAAGPVRAGRGAVRRQPPERLRRTVRAALVRRSWPLIRGVGAASLLLVFVVPIAPVMIAVAFVFWMSLSFGGPFHLRLWGAMYPARLVGRVVGFIGMGRAAAGALAAFAGGVVADRLGGPTAVAIAGAVGVACALAYAGLRARSAERRAVVLGPWIHPRPPRATVARQGRARPGLLRRRPDRGRRRCTPSSMSTGSTCACPMSASIGIMAAVATTISFPIWGAVADRHGGLWALRLGSSLGVIGLIGYALAPDVADPVGHGRRLRGGERGGRRRHRLDRQRPDAAGVAGRRDGRLERHHRRPRDRGRVPHERAAAARGRGRDVGAAPVRGRVGGRRGDVRARERRGPAPERVPVPRSVPAGSTVPTA